jgi:hypothetical protein
MTYNNPIPRRLSGSAHCGKLLSKKNFKHTLLIFLLAAPLCAQAKDFVWFDGGHVTYSVQKIYSPVVEKAIDMFSSDMKAVTGKKAQLKSNGKIAIYQLDKTNDKELANLDKLKVPYMRFITRKDAFWVGVRDGQLVVVGSNGRGTAYGLLELSRLAGVSPWIWWGDVKPEHRSRLTFDDSREFLQSPSVEYRGIFINDEDWSSRVWDKLKMDRHSGDAVIGPRYYHALFELMLRLKANTLWPAMHKGTRAFFTVKGNKEVADSFSIVLGSSHCEPILRNNVGEWDEKKMGPYNFITNRKRVEEYWRQRAQETASMEAIYTLGMRGIHDGMMQGVKTPEQQLKGLQHVINFQRKMLSSVVNKHLKQIPQVFVPYKEVLKVYESGLKVPDDVTLLWCDDNYGYLTRLSNAEEQRRSGGAGVYYHLSYWGRPHDYLWLTTLQPGLLFYEMRQAWDHNARKLWIVNVHDPKVAAYDLSLFMDMAWNINCVSANTLQQHLQRWLVEQFGTQAGRKLVKPMTDFYRLCGQRRPEFMGWNQVELSKKLYKGGLSPVQDTEFSADEFGNELERYLSDFDRVKQEVEAAERLIRPELADAFFAAIKYPVYCAAAMATKQLQAQEARHIGRKESFHHDEEALESAVRSWKAYEQIRQLTQYYNNELSAGKWNGLMDMAPRNLPVFGEPSLPDALTSEEIKKYANPAPVETKLVNDGCVVSNACDYDEASGAVPVQMLGHSMKAVALQKGGHLTYRFYAPDGDAVLRLALIPTQPNDNGDLRFSVSVDGGDPQVFSLKEPYRSEQWKLNVLRGQALRTVDVHFAAGSHTLTIQALDPHIVVDQWMIDYDKDRLFYLFPIRPAL